MAFSFWGASAALLFAGAVAASDQGPNAPIVQPGAPGQSSKILTPATAAAPAPAVHDADVAFMQGMIHHHAQAVDMTGLLRTRSRNKRLQALGKRMSISQTDEIKFMEQWLKDRGKPLSLGHDHMNHSGNVSSMPMMPGMLSPEQMKALAKASGPAFDRLFLTGMIQHHTGALVMVEDLFDTPGAGQDGVMYDFATDIDNTQTAEIKIMQDMLKEKP